MYDVIIVGARCAGASLAMLLARHGAKVLLVDRATFPSEIPHGHFVHRHGPSRLRKWGLLEKVAAATPGVDAMILDLGDFPLTARNLVEDGLPWGYGPRRATLDKILVDAAVNAGAELREGVAVDDYLFEGGRLVGIRGRAAGNRPVEERALLTVGADGRHSRLARAVRAAVYNAVDPILCYYFSYWAEVEAELFELYVRPSSRRMVFSFRTEGDLFAVFIALPMEELPEARRDIEGTFMQSLETVPDLAARVRAGRRAERFYGATDLPNFYRKPFGPGWALVGDAGLHKDPYFALGVCDALRDAELLADEIMAGLGGHRAMDDTLARYEQRRNEATAADYEENIAAARFTPPPPVVSALRAAVRNRPHEATRLIKAGMYMIDPAAFFNPENVQRLLAGANADGAETSVTHGLTAAG